MHLNTDPVAPRRKPCLRDLARLTETLLRPDAVMLAPLPELERRLAEIDASHPQYREETPLVLAYERKRRGQFAGQLLVHRRQQVA